MVHEGKNEAVGLLKKASIVKYNEPTNSSGASVEVQLAGSTDKMSTITIPAPFSLFNNNGLFIGTHPAPDKNKTPIIIGQGQGGAHYFVSYAAEGKNRIPELKPNELLISSEEKTKITLDKTSNISIGSDSNKIHINTNINYIVTNFDTKYDFTQASRRVTGKIKREINFPKIVPQSLDDNTYEKDLKPTSLDPKISENTILVGALRNPAFVEDREMIYEFAPDANVLDDLTESKLYDNKNPAVKNYTAPNRRKSKFDTLSLTLLSPNFLMETVKGTVVDIFGNILDLNRAKLPIGEKDATFSSDTVKDKSKGYLKIKELERKSIAYHFELNARKDFSNKDGLIVIPDIKSNNDYARNRSRFFIDIDKEGQFKLNVPASSETGNIPLLTRYENYSSYGDDDNGNPDKRWQRADGLDIFQDSFAAYNTKTGKIGDVKLDSDGADGAPIDRITKDHIKHGTAYHRVTNTCYSHQSSTYLNYPNEVGEDNFKNRIDIEAISKLKNIVTDTISISGNKANAGGRSGSINFDGSIDLNIGANTVDRQSMWIDSAGAIVANVGRDRKGMSMALSMDGDAFMQFGGWGVISDSRFDSENNNYKGAVLDIRVLNSGGRATLIRVDDEGIKIMTPGNLNIHSNKCLTISADDSIVIDAEHVEIQGRMVIKELGGSI